jgi:hypothetical protein
MFEKFAEECAEHPNQAEVRFFNESILEKMNRSATQFTKKKTPFLDDKRYVNLAIYATIYTAIFFPLYILLFIPIYTSYVTYTNRTKLFVVRM